MKIGRNDPCPCGSGKKYKKCCMRKDEEERRVINIRNGNFSSAASTIMESDETEEATKFQNEDSDPLWNEFEAEDYEGKLKLFTKAMDEPELLDSEIAFEMLNILFRETTEQGERSRFNALVNEFRQRLPEVYADSATYCLNWCIINALIDGHLDDIPGMILELAEMAGKDIDIFNEVVDRLAYFGHLSILIEAMRIAWPKVKESNDIVPWAIDEFEGQAIAFELFYYLENCTSPDTEVKELRKRIEKYIEIDTHWLSSQIEYLTRKSEKKWTMEDFSLPPLRRRNHEDLLEEDNTSTHDPSRENFFNMSLEFIGYLRHEEGVPYTKAELARCQIVSYILKRHAGELEHRESLLEIARGRKKSKTKPKPSRVDHILCPDLSTLDRFFGQLLNFLNPQYYKVTATFELIPAWLRFLESLQLIDGKQHERTLSTLTPLRKDLMNWLETQCNDTALQEAILQAWPD